MEKERKVKTLSLVALIVAILGLTVAFAAMSTTLNINGTATLDTAKWDIHFANLKTGVTKGAAVIKTPATLTGGTNIGSYDVTLTKPGDSVTYEFDVENKGTIDATISTFTKATTPKCTSTISNTADANLVCGNLTYTLTYDTVNGAAVKSTDPLNAGQTRHMVLTLAYKDTATTLPTNDVEISDLGITIVYMQK